LTRIILAAFLLTLLPGCQKFKEIFDPEGARGTKLVVNSGEIYYRDGVTAEEADRLGKFLVAEGYFDGTGKTIQVLKEGDSYAFRMVIKQEYLDNEDFKTLLRHFGGKVSRDVFNGKAVVVHFCDDQLKTHSSGAMLDPDPFGKRYKFEHLELFAKGNVSPELAEKLVQSLAKSAVFKGEEVSVQIVEENGSYQLRYVPVNFPLNALEENALRQVARDLTNSFLSKAPIEVHACDEFFKTRAVIKVTK